ncbi:MAG: hypothetical protein ACI81L_003318 [Verrucomicrobiales bacterium]|jgi:hypothetical protein
MAEETPQDTLREIGPDDRYPGAGTLRQKAALIVKMGDQPNADFAPARLDFLRRVNSEQSGDLGDKTWFAAATALMAFEMQYQIEIYWDWRSPDTDFIRRDIALLLARLDGSRPPVPQDG